MNVCITQALQEDPGGEYRALLQEISDLTSLLNAKHEATMAALRSAVKLRWPPVAERVTRAVPIPHPVAVAARAWPCGASEHARARAGM